MGPRLHFQLTETSNYWDSALMGESRAARCWRVHNIVDYEQLCAWQRTLRHCGGYRDQMLRCTRLVTTFRVPVMVHYSREWVQESAVTGAPEQSLGGHWLAFNFFVPVHVYGSCSKVVSSKWALISSWIVWNYRESNEVNTQHRTPRVCYLQQQPYLCIALS